MQIVAEKGSRLTAMYLSLRAQRGNLMEWNQPRGDSFVTLFLGNCSMRRLRRLLLVLYLLHAPGQPLDRFPVSPSPCSRRNDDTSALP
jgi:hypothetical protein